MEARRARPQRRALDGLITHPARRLILSRRPASRAVELPPLIEDFGAEKTAEEIRACADLMLQPYDDVPVRSFVLALARRNAQECLRDGRCAELV